MILHGPVRVAARRGVRGAAYVAISLLGYAGQVAGRRRGQLAPLNLPERILIIRLDLLGDVLFSTAAAKAMRESFSGARIVMLTLPYTSRLAAICDAVDDVIVVDTNRIRTMKGLLDPRTWIEYWQVFRRLRAERFDVCLSLCGQMASLWALLSGARRSIGYAGEAYPFVLTDPVPGGRYAERVHDVDYVLRLAHAAGARTTGSKPSIEPSAAHLHVATKLLEDRGIAPSDKVVVIHPGAGNGSAKRWPTNRWARFAEEVSSRTGARIVLVGGEGDRGLADEIMAATINLVSVVGDTSVEELVGILVRADVVATGDSGPLHIAVALGRPLVAAYGPTDPRIHGPFRPSSPALVHRHDLPCSPCYTMAATAECPLGDPICMRLVSVVEMVESAVRLLSRGSPRGAAGAMDLRLSCDAG